MFYVADSVDPQALPSQPATPKISPLVICCSNEVLPDPTSRRRKHPIRRVSNLLLPTAPSPKGTAAGKREGERALFQRTRGRPPAVGAYKARVANQAVTSM